MQLRCFVLLCLTAIFILGFSNVSYGQGVQTSGGVNVDGSWYLGEGLKQGDYFEYTLCHWDLNECEPISFQMWVKGDKQVGNETRWLTEVLVIDGNKIIRGDMELGKVSLEPLDSSEVLKVYKYAFKNSVTWLYSFDVMIDNLGSGRSSEIYQETIRIPAGTFESTVIEWLWIGENNIWVTDEIPFPIKAKVWVQTTVALVAHLEYEFVLLDYKKNITCNPFDYYDLYDNRGISSFGKTSLYYPEWVYQVILWKDQGLVSDDEINFLMNYLYPVNWVNCIIN